MSNILLSDLTNSTNTSNGTGVFDVLMSAVELRIQKQFKQKRITSDDYATVYLGAIQSTLAESIKFLLSEQAAGLEADLLAKKIFTEEQNALLIAEKIQTEDKQNTTGGVLDGQIAKLEAEKLLLNEKTHTEEAQTKDVVNGAVVTGIVGKKKELFTAQTNGFARDAEQKMAKIMVDTWNVAKTADPTGVSGNTSNKLTDDDIGQVIAKAKAGIGT